jgi:hypothetical protein
MINNQKRLSILKPMKKLRKRKAGGMSFANRLPVLSMISLVAKMMRKVRPIQKGIQEVIK